MTPSTNIVLQTKLRCPPLPPGLLTRSRLLAQLDAGASCTLTLIIAPAGSGKTSLVRQWMEQQKTPVAWLQLDANDSDPSLFFTYIVHALRQISPHFGAETEILLQSARLPPLAVLVHTLSNEINQLGLPCLLVLDDYHLVQNPEIEAALADLVLRPPTDFRLLVISRQVPAWSLSRLRVENRLLTIDADDLRFTAAETAAYLQLNAVPAGDAELAARLQEQTEGWAAGLQLALLTLRRTHEEQVLFGPQAPATGFDGRGSRYLLEYMVDEVLAKLPPDLLAFMYATSLCTQFTASLCQALTGMERERVRGYLHLLETANLFLIPLGSLEDRHAWYRFHHLMGQTLDSRRQEAMTPEALADLHHRAAAWLGAHGYIEEALEHCIAGEDWEAAAQLAVDQSSLLFDREDRRTIERWLARFPAAEIAARPHLLLMQTWSCFFNLDLPGVAQSLVETRSAAARPEASEPAQVNDCQNIEGQCLLLQGVVDYFAGNAEAAIEATQRALPLLANASAFFHASAYFYLGSTMQFAGQGEEAQELLLEAYRRQPKPSQPSARILFGIATVRLFDGHLNAAHESAELLLQESRAAHLILLEGWAHDILGRIDLERNRLDAAESHFAVLRERSYALHRGCAYDGYTGSMLVAAVQGRRDTVTEIAEEWRSFEQSLWGLPGSLHHSARARAALLLGDEAAAQRWAAKFTVPLGPPPMVWLETSHISKLRCLLASGAARDLQAADDLSLACLAHAEHMHNVSAYLALLALRSLVLDGRGQRKAAVELLRRALHLAAPEGFVRTFVELGPNLLNLLGAVDDPELADYAAGLRAAFKPVPSRSPARLQDSPAAALTQRELEVLALLATPLSLQEIGDKLFISYSTVRQHTAHIYEKLGVGKRRHAVLAATELGLMA